MTIDLAPLVLAPQSQGLTVCGAGWRLPPFFNDGKFTYPALLDRDLMTRTANL